MNAVLENPASSLAEKEARLDEGLRRAGRLMVAYSGGVDSAYLAWRARRVLGRDMLAVIADSPSLARRDLADAVAFAREHRLPLEILRTAEMDNPAYVKNDALRCFHCKSELFARMREAGERLGFRQIAYGMNTDDGRDFRPGQRAAQQHGVLAPLAGAGLGKDDIRQLARAAGLRVWDRPASPCLSSRLAYGQPVTNEALRRIEAAEEHLRRLGLARFRVRDHGGVARIEVAEEEMETILSVPVLRNISSAFKTLGFTYAAVDCEGYRSGSLNRALPAEALADSHAPGLS